MYETQNSIWTLTKIGIFTVIITCGFIKIMVALATM